MNRDKLTEDEIAAYYSCKLEGHRVFNYVNWILCRTCDISIAHNGKNYTGELQE